jgi:hypothetical protein
LLDHLNLASEARGIHACPAPGHRLGRSRQEGCTKGGSRGGVSNAHFPNGKDVDAVAKGEVDLFTAGIHGGGALWRMHGAFPAKAAGASADVALEKICAEPWPPRVGFIHPSVHDVQRSAGRPRQHADGRASTKKVADHLGGDLRRIGAHPLGGNSVAPGEDADPEGFSLGKDSVLEQTELETGTLEQAEGTVGLCLNAQSLTQCMLERRAPARGALKLRGARGGRWMDGHGSS